MTEASSLIHIAGPAMSAEINPVGAELTTLRDHGGCDLLWDGDPAFWTGRAPILFPIVGAAAGGAIRVGGRDYSLPQHGFARRRSWALVEQAADAATFRLEADDATRAVYPFEFRLDLRFAIDDAGLSMEATLSNPGARDLLAAFGFHPALRWPLPGGGDRAAHVVRFAQDEPAPIRRIDDAGLVLPESFPSPVQGRDLPLADDLFTAGALIFDQLASRRLRYGAPGGTMLDISFPDMPMLGLWTKPGAGAGYLCIEPWQGHADPVGFTGEFADKPGIVRIAPGRNRVFTMRIDSGSETF